jgi:hypothetical protein
MARWSVQPQPAETRLNPVTRPPDTCTLNCTPVPPPPVIVTVGVLL